MKTYIAKWQNGSVSVLTAEDKVELFDKLDTEGDPFSCELLEVGSKTGQFHLSFEIANQGGETFIGIDEPEVGSGLKKIKLPKDVFEKHLSRVMNKPLKQIKAISNLQEIKKQMGIDQ
jgi:hypothetical protein